VRENPSTRYVMLTALAGAVIYGVIGAITLRWYWGVFLALWALVLGAIFSVLKARRRKKYPQL
jgi:Flp pilus assembly protein TadB